MEYTDWNYLIVILKKDGVELNRALFMRRDFNETDSISVKNLLNDVSNSMVRDVIKTNEGFTTCENWNSVILMMTLDDKEYKSFESTRNEVENSLFDLGYFLYDSFITLTDKNKKLYKPTTILYSEEVLSKETEQHYSTITGKTITDTIDDKNIKFGDKSLFKNKKGIDNIAIGQNSLTNNVSSGNIGIGKGSLATNREGSNNTSVGRYSLAGIVRGVENVAIGKNAGKVTSKGQNNNESNRSLFLGSNTKPLNDKTDNEIVIGSDSVGNGSNTTTIGNDKTTESYIRGKVKSDGYKSSDGSVGITTTFKTVDGLTITVKDGLIVSIK